MCPYSLCSSCAQVLGPCCLLTVYLFIYFVAIEEMKLSKQSSFQVWLWVFNCSHFSQRGRLIFCFVLCRYLLLYLWLYRVSVAVQAFSSCSEWGVRLFAALQLLIAVVSLAGEHGL